MVYRYSYMMVRTGAGWREREREGAAERGRGGEGRVLKSCGQMGADNLAHHAASNVPTL